jgi:hypothetical protein
MRSKEIEEGKGLNEETRRPLTVGSTTYFQDREDAIVELLFDIRDQNENIQQLLASLTNK